MVLIQRPTHRVVEIRDIKNPVGTHGCVEMDVCSDLILLACGDRVQVLGLVSKASEKFNGSKGTVIGYHEYKKRYEVKLDASGDSDEQVGNIAVKPGNLQFLHRKSKTHAKALHLLIPSHVNTERRFRTFTHCAESVSKQVEHDFVILISMSGSEKHVEKSVTMLRKIADKSPDLLWFVKNDKEEAIPQFQHMRALSEVSKSINPEAWLLFLDNDDLFHPRRVSVFREVLNNLPREQDIHKLPFNISCKLLLDEHVTVEEGDIDRLVSGSNDFNEWRKSSSLSRKVKVASSKEAAALDANEFFDYCVPSWVLFRFMERTPVAITSYKFVDLRFNALLDRISKVEVEDPLPWLLAHYKVSLKSKHTAFDDCGKLKTKNAEDQTSTNVKPEDLDKDLSRLFKRFNIAGKLEPEQIAYCRNHVESVVIQYYGWDSEALEAGKKLKVKEIDDAHGQGLGDFLWTQANEKFEAAFEGIVLPKASPLGSCPNPSSRF